MFKLIGEKNNAKVLLSWTYFYVSYILIYRLAVDYLQGHESFLKIQDSDNLRSDTRDEPRRKKQRKSVVNYIFYSVLKLINMSIANELFAASETLKIFSSETVDQNTK